MPDSPISMPAGYAPAFAIGFSEAGSLAMVDAARPLPVIAQPAQVESPAPLQGSAAGTGQFGPYSPVTSRPVMIALTGTWQGQVRILRSVDGGITRLPLTLAGSAWGQYTGAACEPVWTEEETGAQLYLDVTLSTGTLSYRLSQ